jgi:hypothetical protein
MIRVDNDEVADAVSELSDILIDLELEPDVAIAAMMRLLRRLAPKVGPPTDDVLDWAVRLLDEEED